MFKKLYILFICLISFCMASLAYDIKIPKGTLVKVYAKVPYTTEHLEVGSNVYFISPSDVWVQETKVISKGDIFLGNVNMLKLPIQGVNAAMSISITDILTPSGEKYSIKGRLIFASKDVLGGDLTNPASYNKTIHPRKVYGNIWGGTMQYVPSGEYEFGSHVGISQKDMIFVQFDEDFYI